jgi:hypothetical protein
MWGFLFTTYIYKIKTMGRFIITEEEKNRIKLLYEVALPPSESVLVANKNPFKYDEYKLARTVYTPQLKDGDMFYQIIKKDDIVTSYKEVIDNLIKIYSEKTLRYFDEIVNVSMDINQYTVNRLDEEYFPYISPLISGYIGGNQEYDVSYRIKPNNYDVSLTFYSYDFDGKTKRSRYSQPTTTSTDPVDKFFISFKNDLLKNLQKIKPENLPDEYFEIRKVQKVKTDFK